MGYRQYKNLKLVASLILNPDVNLMLILCILLRLISEKEDLRNELSLVSSSFAEMSEIATSRQNEIDNIKREQMVLQDEIMVAR